jgi:hypothetical protein
VAHYFRAQSITPKKQKGYAAKYFGGWLRGYIPIQYWFE